MPLQKLQFKPGINKEVTSYSNEGGWNDCDKVIEMNPHGRYNSRITSELCDMI